MDKPRLWSGGRFEQLKDKLSGRPGVTNPAGLAAFLGRKRYGAAIFNKHAASARRGIFK